MNEVIEKKFTYHPPKSGQQEKYVAIREKAKELAYLIEDMCPDSVEKWEASRSLQSTVFWANASISMNE